jgi:hypothetical protein
MAIDPKLRVFLEERVHDLDTADVLGDIARGGRPVLIAVAVETHEIERGVRKRGGVYWVRTDGAGPRIVGQTRRREIRRTIELLRKALVLWGDDEGAR